MPVDRKLFKTPFSKKNPPQWLCPTCKKGILKGENKNFFVGELKQSRDKHGEPDWEPECISRVFSCMLNCTNSKCKEIVACTGDGFLNGFPVYSDVNDEYPTSMDYDDCYKPLFFKPHLNIFQIPKNTPENIKEEINNSFELFFINPSSSSSHARITLELILNYLKVKRFITKGGRRRLISLHGRINLLPKKFNGFEDLFLAIKWLGNSGSHSDKISVDDVMDAYDILETILEELFENKIKSIKKLAKKINKKRGPKK